jgi:ribosomal-protein-alanine N-acetyltransferase
LGEGFVKAGLDFARSRCPSKAIQLEVATFNTRAIGVYERLGFVEVEHFLKHTNGGEFSFIRMELACQSEGPP